MKSLAAIACVALLGTTLGTQALAHGTDCNVKSLAGHWVFATGIGRQMLGGPFPPDKDITALGTMRIRPGGRIEGEFDVTVEDTMFLPDVTFAGSIVLYPDCTGYVTFVTSTGAVRTDSVAVVNARELLGMSQDPANLWTYQMRRVAWSTARYSGAD